jgi:hypothetical protein
MKNSISHQIEYCREVTKHIESLQWTIDPGVRSQNISMSCITFSINIKQPKQFIWHNFSFYELNKAQRTAQMVYFIPLKIYPQVCYRKEDVLLCTFLIPSSHSWKTLSHEIKYRCAPYLWVICSKTYCTYLKLLIILNTIHNVIFM